MLSRKIVQRLQTPAGGSAHRQCRHHRHRLRRTRTGSVHAFRGLIELVLSNLSHPPGIVSAVQLVSLVSVTRKGVTVEINGAELHLEFTAPTIVNASRLPLTVAYSEARGLLAVGCQDGPIIPIDRDHGVFGLLGPSDRYVFIKVSS